MTMNRKKSYMKIVFRVHISHHQQRTPSKYTVKHAHFASIQKYKAFCSTYRFVYWNRKRCWWFRLSSCRWCHLWFVRMNRGGHGNCLKWMERTKVSILNCGCALFESSKQPPTRSHVVRTWEQASYTYRQVSSLCELCRRKLRQRIISSVVLCRRNPREMRISSVVLWRRMAGRGAHSGGGGGGRAHGLGSL